MIMNPVPANSLASVVSTLQGVRTGLEQAMTQRMDVAPVLSGAKSVIDDVHGTVDDMRKFAPALGEVWDTLRTVLNAATTGVNSNRPAAGEGITIPPADASPVKAK